MARQFLPALRGVFGDWAYYICLMSLADIGARVKFADQIHQSKALSDLIQRKLKDARADDIAAYLKSTLSASSARSWSLSTAATQRGTSSTRSSPNTKTSKLVRCRQTRWRAWASSASPVTKTFSP